MPDDLIGKVISIISGGEEPDSEKKTLLKLVVKEISQNKYAKFFRLKSEEIDPSFAAYIYEIYKIVYPACAFVQNTAKLSRVKHISVEAFMDKGTLELARKLRPEVVQERVKAQEPKVVSAQLKEDLNSFVAVFDSKRIANINRCYNLNTALIQFAQFNFLSILRRFDTGLPEGNGPYTPRFQPAKAADLIEELRQFRAVIQHLEPGDDWKNALTILKIARDGQELIPLNQWNMLLMNLREFKNSNIIELIGQYTTKNPVWRVKSEPIDEQLAENWLEAKRSDVQGVIDRIVTSQRNGQIETLATAVFGTPEVTRLQYYNQETTDACNDIGLDGFLYAGAMNYLTAFVQDFLSKEMQELCDILLVRGQWIINSQSMEMSNAIHTINDATESAADLDLLLSETGTFGPRFSQALVQADRNKTQARFIDHVAGELDETALTLINTAVQSLVVVGKHMKNLLGDTQKSPPELIINWKELGYFTKVPISQRITEAYKKINYFVQLMLLLTHPESA
ncbi:hypothetical protein TREPR_1989 [Treponema primitia ZAS-2]|uniref:Uncharacterized protein n=1 Tax=Treponema primitia (strain ATCC BAA-887 / DSM 12427 / ZAS-2) TaxID=545694 RepID=F5YKE6_TREPZ|nr:DUF5312 family protein [Treponema primitia]AEF85923.1 hypothetical protein TREPR_1989 [Treponema primitia ZAS-2]